MFEIILYLENHENLKTFRFSCSWSVPPENPKPLDIQSPSTSPTKTEVFGRTLGKDAKTQSSGASKVTEP